jgi:hypothetical protein
MSDTHLVLHGLAIKKHGTAEAVAGLMGMDAAEVGRLLDELAGGGRVVAAQGKYMLTPLARMALDGDYSRYYGELRSDPAFVAAYDAFEHVNTALKALITDWQTVEVGGERLINTHADADYDRRIIDRLGELHERALTVLGRFAAALPRMAVYRDKLEAALEKAEDGAVEWVSDAKLDSYHTVWFELHEDLLRMLGRERVE